MATFVNPFTDFGFKKIFGEEASKPFLIDFLNSMLPAHHQISQLTLKNSEQLGINELDRKSIYDIYCESITGEKFIVELQRTKQDCFKDRTIYYSTFPIAEQSKKGNWEYRLNAVYSINILNFVFDKNSDEVFYQVKLKDQFNEVFYDKLTFIYLQMPNFKKSEHELTTNLDKWLFFIKNLDDLQSIPQIFKNSLIEQAFVTANVATFNYDDRLAYERILKYQRDLYVEKTQEIRKVLNDERAEIAKNFLKLGIANELVAQSAHLTLEQIQAIKETL